MKGDDLRRAVREKYAIVAAGGDGRFAYPVGRESARRLGYADADFAGFPDAVVDRFVGIGNPLRMRMPRAGERVLDVGCGAGFDALIASRKVGSSGRVVAVDVAPEMLAIPRAALHTWSPSNVEFREGSAEDLPFDDASFDLVFSNGALNLVVDKDRAFREIRRVLAPGGALAVADLLILEAVPADLVSDMDAWST